MNSRFLSRVVMAAVLAGIAGCPSFEKPDLSVKTARLASADFNGAVVDVTVTLLPLSARTWAWTSLSPCSSPSSWAMRCRASSV